MGSAIDLLPYFVLAFHILGQWGLGGKDRGKRGRCFLDKVESVNSHGETQVIYVGEDQSFTGDYSVITPMDILNSLGNKSFEKIILNFITLTRVKSDNTLQDSIDFEMLFRSLLRRALSLSYFHCDHEPDVDYKGMTQRAGQNIRKVSERLEWNDWSRYSRRQDSRIMLGGFKGEVIFEGKLDEFIPLLMLGEYIHVGKGTAFGLGKYNMESQD
jgi:hypothetical protein